MKIVSADFIVSVADINKYKQVASADEICMVGRSNVGKSTFINMLTGRNKLAKTSSTPGRTRLINLFAINNGQFTLVDLPGYGYAAAAKTDKEKWGELIEQYLGASTLLKHVFALVDSRHDPSALDIQMLKYLQFYQLPFTVIATKADKLSGAELGRHIMKISSVLGIGRDNIIPVSASGLNKDKVLNKLGIIFNADNSTFDLRNN